jgi:hypothetical protein
VRREKFQSLLAAAAQFSPVASSAKPQPAPSNPSKRIYRGYTKNSKPVPVEAAQQSSIGQALPGPKPKKNIPGIRSLNRETWFTAIMGVVNKVDGPVSYPELREALLPTPFGEKIRKNDKVFYTAVMKLKDNRMLVVRNKHLFSLSAHEKFMKALENKEISDVGASPRAYRSRLGDGIKAILKNHPTGLESKGIMAELKRIPEFEYAADPDKTFVYNVLKRLIEIDSVRKDGSLYILNHPDDSNDNALGQPYEDDYEGPQDTEAAPTVKEGAA